MSLVAWLESSVLVPNGPNTRPFGSSLGVRCRVPYRKRSARCISRLQGLPKTGTHIWTRLVILLGGLAEGEGFLLFLNKFRRPERSPESTGKGREAQCKTIGWRSLAASNKSRRSLFFSFLAECGLAGPPRACPRRPSLNLREHSSGPFPTVCRTWK